MTQKADGLYIALLSIHGLIRWHNLELGRDADTGGQTLYVVELAQALAKQPGIGKVDLITQRVDDGNVSSDYATPIEIFTDNLRIVRIDAGPEEYLYKEELWDHLDFFTDNLADFFRNNNCTPDIIHSHYADAGYVGSRLASLLGIPQVHTGHSLGRVKRSRLLASGLKAQEIENRFKMSRRIEAEELALATAERVITSTHQEISEQYEIYDHYQPDQMRVVPPGTDLNQFTPATGRELSTPLFKELTSHLKSPGKPIILALSRPDRRKNITALIDAFGLSTHLQELANLIIIAGNRDDINDLEDGAQEVFHELLVAIDRYDLYGKVTLPKHHRRDQVAMIYQIAATSGGVFVNPALTEPFGLTLIEAAACGLPIVATEDGGPQDIVSNCNNGFLIDPLEPGTITEALLKLLEEPKIWQKCSSKGLRGVKKNYSWNAHAKRYLTIVKPIAERSEQLLRIPVKQRTGLYRDRAIVSDLDHNLIGKKHSLQKLAQLLRQNRTSSHFIIATGRRLESALKLMKKHKIPEPDVLITSSGSEIYHAPKLVADTAWTKHIDHQWSPRKIKSLLTDTPGLKIQPNNQQSSFKLSYYIDPKKVDIEAIKQLLHSEELAFFIQTAFGQFLDILPLRASKGMALRYVVEQLDIPLESVFVAGGSGADEDMMRGNTLAAVVANRHHEELSQLDDIERIYFSSRPNAAGILEALEYYDFFGACRDPNETEMSNRLLLCTDMDRTIIPNGRHPEHPNARVKFRQLCSFPEINLVYVTGRHLQLMVEGIGRYNLPEPAYAITDVGTKIYQNINDNWIELLPWQEQIAKDWQGKTHNQLQLELSGVPELKLQEPGRQNDYKLSYYLPLNADQGKILQQVDQLLIQMGVAASLIMSIDEPEQVGLLDILPQSATKLHAIEFLRRHLDFGLDETIFCGDSGNDLPVLGSQIRSILVANAEQDIKKQALELTEKNINKESLYLADNKSFPLGGNYSAGVLQGIAFYAPEIIKNLEIS